MKLKKLRLTLNVAFNPNGVKTPLLKEHLLQVVKDAVNNGTLTGESPAEVETYTFKITEIRRKHKKEKKKSNVVNTFNYKGHNIYICEDSQGLYATIADQDGLPRGSTPYRNDMESVKLIAENMIDKF